MKRQIRRSCFETNSSSTHAICITKEDYTKSNYIEFEIGEFGWEFDIYSDVHSRASYLITAIFNSGKDYADEKLQQLKDILDDNGIEYVIPTPKVDSWTYDGKTRYYYDINGYIDHVEETREFVEAVLSDSDPQPVKYISVGFAFIAVALYGIYYYVQNYKGGFSALKKRYKNLIF